MHNLKLVCLASLMVAVAPAAASAQGAFDDAYGGQGNEPTQVAPAAKPVDQAQVADDSATAPASTPSSATPTSKTSSPTSSAPTAARTTRAASGSLPFTGMDAGLVALAGLAVLALGLGVRRLSRTQPVA